MRKSLAALTGLCTLALFTLDAGAAANKTTNVYGKATNPFGAAAESLVERGHATAGDGQAVWRRDGTYEFHSNKGKNWKGKWRVVGDQICVQYTSGYSRCDEIRKLGDHWVLVTQWGEHYPLH